MQFRKNERHHVGSIAADRAEAVAERLWNETGIRTVRARLGSGNVEHLPGSTSSGEHLRGRTDLHIVGMNVLLQVTGPMAKSVIADEDLWIRPGWVESARDGWPEMRTFVVHWLERDGTLRVIPLDEDFYDAFDRGGFSLVSRKIRGKLENYVGIPAWSSHVINWDDFILWLYQQDPMD